MFVAIDNRDMSAPRVLDWINRTKNANNNVISPEFAMEILGKTNFYGHIKAVLKNIKENCSDKNGELVADKVLEYKEFILSCINRREMSPDAMKDLQEMAVLCECEDELKGVNRWRKLYKIHDCEGVTVDSKEKFKELKGEGLKVFFCADEVCLSECDLSKADSINFVERASVDLSRAKNFPKNLDLSSCSTVKLDQADLSGVKEIKFAKYSNVSIDKATIDVEYLDLSHCSDVKGLADCWLRNIKKIRLKDKRQADRFLDGVLHKDKLNCEYVYPGYLSIKMLLGEKNKDLQS